MRMLLARQERIPLQAMGWADLSRQTSMAVRRLLPQERARLAGGNEGLARAKSARVSLGGTELSDLRLVRSGGMTTERKARRASAKNWSGGRPEQVPWVVHSWARRLVSGVMSEKLERSVGGGASEQTSG